MTRMAQFALVSQEQFLADWKAAFETEEGAREAYKALRLPQRATKGSAGYDFFAPKDFSLAPGESVLLPTGIRVKMEAGWFLACYPRSGLGFRYRLQLNNTVGIIDGDYYDSDNEGHIMARLTNDTREGKTVTVKQGTGFMQGIFTPFGITWDDAVTQERNGGFGSTTKKEETR